MHQHSADAERLAEAILAYAEERFRLDPVPLDAPRTHAELTAAVGETITADGIGGERALELFSDVLSHACISVDHPRFLSFIPAAPTEAAMLFDLVVGASSLYGGSWLEASGAVYAENQALRWVADLAGFPPAAGGVFTQGGTTGNLSALVAARHTIRERRGTPAGGFTVVASDQVHSSVAAAARVMDVAVTLVPSDAEGRMRGDALRGVLAEVGDQAFAVVATAGTTNLGVVDRLDEAADACAERGLWLHVDAAYGGAALAASSVRHLFEGIERADSFVVDPHKWLFAPFDCCALVYREPELGRRAHTQEAGYLEPLHTGEWNPSDYAINLTRRARGLPFWFSLATHGTRAYTAAIERTLEVSRYSRDEIRRRARTHELLHEPDLTVLVFRRLGWSPADYAAWSDRLLQANLAFVLPTTHRGETVARFAIVNPRTSETDISTILDTMA
ncbi:MAG: pyridoxal phosphate-dependent decarboxylase family protein [Gaiella sp.]